jgi:WD40 repeat protein
MNVRRASHWALRASLRVAAAFMAMAAGPAMAQATNTLAAPASEPPVLQIELGEHLGPVRRIAADLERNLVITGADDATARIWSLDTGSPLRVLRPSAGPDGQGRVFGVALHPTRPWVAIGGTAGSAQARCIELYDVHTGELVRCIDALGGDIRRLQWTHDGRFLVAAYAGTNGVRVFDEQGALVFAEAFPARVSALAVSQGRLAAAGFDGTLRIYDVPDEAHGGVPVRLRVTRKLAAGASSLAFSPDGRALAVGYIAVSPASLGHAPDIIEWEGGAARTLPLPDDMRSADLRAVAWSRAGRVVAAGSYGYSRGQVSLVTYDPVRARVLGTDHAAKSSVTDIAALADGSLTYSTADGAWGVVGSGKQQKPVLRRSVLLPEVVGAGHLRASEDGRRISWNLAGASGRVMFDLDRHEVFEGRGADLPSPVLTRGFLHAPRRWENFPDPTVNGAAIALQEGELSRAVSLFPAPASDAVLGTSMALFRIGAEGRVVWRVPTHTEVRAVIVAREGRIIVTAMLDGSVRLWNARTGKELLAVLVLPDKRWIAWTPSGYYDASLRAEDLIGWRVSRGRDAAAEFFRVSRFRGRFYRPDVLDSVMETLDEAAGVERANADMRRPTLSTPIDQMLPPVVDLLTPAQVSTSARQLAVRVRIRSLGEAPVADVWVRIDGQLTQVLQRGPGASEQGEERELILPLPERDAQVQVFASNRHGSSEPVKVQVRWTGAALAPSAMTPAVRKSNLYVLAIGVARYQHVENLKYAGKDAVDFAATMKRQEGLMYDKVETQVLVDERATRDEVVNGLDWLQRQVTQHDVGMIFISGHGVNDATMGYTFLPVNADPAKLRSTGVPTEEIRRTIAGLVGKSVLFIDTCHAGNVLGAGRRKAMNDMTGVINELASAESGTVVFSASTGRQYSMEDDQWKNSAFTKALVEGLSGEADTHKSGRVTHAALAYFISERVKQMTRGEQSPVTSSEGVPDFPLVVVK